MSREKKIDILEALKMRSEGQTLRQIGAHFKCSAEAARQALDNYENKKRKRDVTSKHFKGIYDVVKFGFVDGEKKEQTPNDSLKIIEDLIEILKSNKKIDSLEKEIFQLHTKLNSLEYKINKIEHSEKISEI